MKKILFILLLLISFEATAQDKYEYAIINHTVGSTIVYVAINGNSFQEVKYPREKGGNKEEKRNINDYSPILLEVNKLTEERWEVYNSDSNVWVLSGGVSGFVLTYFLRRKKAA